MSRPLAGAGIGLRFAHHAAVLADRSRLAWVEVHPENYMAVGTRLAELEAIRRDVPIALHGVGLSLGSAEGLDVAHLDRLADLVARLEPAVVSEHVAWCVAGNRYHAELLPLPMTEEALDVMCRAVARTQERLGRAILVENPSCYLRFAGETIEEPVFLAEIVRRTGCGLLCDVNNLAVNAANLGVDPAAWLRALPADAIGEIHVAGHTVRVLDDATRLCLDDHASAPSAEVWALYRQALELFGPVPTLLEWDHDLPPLDVLLAQAALADRWLDDVGDARTR